MQEHLSLNEDEQASLAPIPPVMPLPPSETSKPLYIHIARYISAILSPIGVSLPTVLLVALYHEPHPLQAVAYTCLTLFFLSVVPMAYIVIGVRLGKFTDVDVSQRSQRSGPFIFGLLSTTLGFLALLLTHGPKNLQTLILLTIISGIIMTIITQWWKISIHASSFAGALTMLTALYGSIILPAYLLLALVCWSRVVLRRHTVTQVVCGSTLSIMLTLIILLLRGM